MYSEHALSRGKAARSTAVTLKPARASRAAAALPPGPVPTTRTSTGASCSGETLVLEAIEDEAVRVETGEREVERQGATTHEADGDFAAAGGPGAGALGGAREALGERLGDHGLAAGPRGVEPPGGRPGLE